MFFTLLIIKNVLQTKVKLKYRTPNLNVNLKEFIKLYENILITIRNYPCTAWGLWDTTLGPGLMAWLDLDGECVGQTRGLSSSLAIALVLTSLSKNRLEKNHKSKQCDDHISNILEI